MNKRLMAACGMLLVQALSVPVFAQTQVAPPVRNQPAPIATPAKPADATITIFGRPKRDSTPANGMTRIDLGSSASGCAFNSRSGSQAFIDAYFEDFYGDDQPIDENGNGLDGQPRINTRSPYGDVSTSPIEGGLTTDNPRGARSRSVDPFGVTTTGAGGCTQAEYNFSAGRAEIARHDHSLRDAFAAYDAGDYPKALELFKYSYTKMGYGAAGLMIGKMYLLGIGTPRDTKEAIVWLKKTDSAPFTISPFPLRPPADYEAMTPEVDSAMTLAKIYAIGWDVPVDRTEARHWYDRATQRDFYPAVQIMGRIYETGWGVPRNIKTAITYFKRAGQMGYAPSQYSMGEIYYYGDDGVPPNKTLAGAWLLLAAKHNHPDALYAVGRMYELGEGGAKVDPVKALVFYKEAAVRGQSDAQNAIGVDFYTGNGVPKDAASARRWFLTASEKGNPDAMFNLGAMMVNGEGGPKDLVHAWCWFSIAQKGGNDQAAAALAELAPKMTADERAQAEALLNPPAEK